MPEGELPTGPACDNTIPNTPIDIYKGNMNITQSDRTRNVEGSIQLKWLPSPTIRFDIPKIDFRIDTGYATIELPRFAMSNDAIVTNVSYHTESGVGSTISCRGILNRESVLKYNGSSGGCNKVFFCLPNFTTYFGSTISEGARWWRGGLNLKNDEWEVTLIQHKDERKITESLSDQGGFAIIHTGTLKKCDGEKFNLEQAKEKILALHYFFSFVRGAWCSPILIKGAEDDKISWEIWGAPKLTAWKSTSNWFYKDEPDSIQETFKGFMSRWDDPRWKEALTTAIHWYVESSINSGGIEGSIVLTQTALEILAWVHLIETPSMPAYTIEEFSKRSAADKIQPLLEAMEIQTHIPPELETLLRFRKHLKTTKGNRLNGPQIFTFIRNRIVHDRTDDPDKLSDIPGMARVEAKWLGLWYLELALLFLCRHKGDYLRSYVHGYRDEVKARVPWIKP